VSALHIRLVVATKGIVILSRNGTVKILFNQ
jgi:hypothetical protein